MAKKIINAFNAGEVTPNVHARTDNELYDSACLKMENFLPLEYGGATRRPATAFLTQLGGKCVFLPFEVTEDENYVLAFEDNLVTVLDTDGSTQAVFDTKIIEGELYQIHYVQSNNVMFISHPNHNVFTITKSTSGWDSSDLDFKVPPLLDLNESSVKISSSKHDGITTLTSNIDFFNVGHEGAYFRFRQPRTFESGTTGKSTSSISHLFFENNAQVSGVSNSINASGVNFEISTSGVFDGKLILQRSFDDISFEDYFVVGDNSGSEDNVQTNFTFGSSEPEPNNSRLRFKFIANSDHDHDTGCTASLRIVEPYYYGLVKVTEFVSATEVKAEVLSELQYGLEEFTEWDTNTDYDEGDRVKSTDAFSKEDYDTGDATLAFRDTANVEVGSHGTAWTTLTTEYYVANSSNTIRETQIVDMAYGNNAIWILDRSCQVHKLTFRSSGKEFDYHGVIFSAASDFPVTSFHADNDVSGRYYNDDKETKKRAVSIAYSSSSNVMTEDSNSYPIAIMGKTQMSSTRRSGTNPNHTINLRFHTPAVDINACTQFAIYFYQEDGTKHSSSKTYNLSTSQYNYREWLVPKAMSYGNRVTVEWMSFEMKYQSGSYDSYAVTSRNRRQQLNIPNLTAANGFAGDIIEPPNTWNTEGRNSLVTGNTYRDQVYNASFDYLNPIAFSGSDQNKNFAASRFQSVVNKTVNSDFFINSNNISDDLTSSTQVASIYIVRDDTNNSARNDFLYVLRTDGELFKYKLEGATRYYRYLVDHDDDNNTLQQLDSSGIVAEEFPETSNFYEGAFSDYRGHPKSLAIHENRLCFGGNKTEPNTLWLSKIDDLNNFELGSLDTSAMKLKFNALKQNEIQWLCSGRELFIGTVENEWSLGSGSDQLPITPTAFNLKRRSSYGSSNVQALLINSAVLFLQRESKKIREWYLQENQADYLASNLAFIAEHITEAGILEMAVQTQPTTTVWMVRKDGVLVGLTYERETKTFAWHRHTFQEGLVDSVSVLPTSTGEDEVYLSLTNHSTSAVRSDSTSEYIQLDTTLTVGGHSTSDVNGIYTKTSEYNSKRQWTNGTYNIRNYIIPAVPPETEDEIGWEIILISDSSIVSNVESSSEFPPFSGWSNNVTLTSSNVVNNGDSVSFDVIIDEIGDIAGANHWILGGSGGNNQGFLVDEDGVPRVRYNGVGENDAIFRTLILTEGHPYNLKYIRNSNREYTCIRTDLKTGEVKEETDSTSATVTQNIDRIFRGSTTSSKATVANVKIVNAHYKLDEGSGTTITDANGSGNDGTFVGSLEWVNITDTPRWNPLNSNILKMDKLNWGTNYLTEYRGLDQYVESYDFTGTEFEFLDHLEGKDVTVIIDGVKQSNTYTVSNGSITLPSQENKHVIAGLPYTSTLAPLYLDANGSMGSKKSVPHAVIRFKDTLKAKVGQKESGTYGENDTSVLEEVRFSPRDVGLGVYPTPSTLKTNDFEVYLANHNEFLQTIYIIQDEPSPCTVLAMVADVEGV